MAFSAINPELPEDESQWVDRVTKHLGIRVNKVAYNPSGKDMLTALDEHVRFHDEPLKDLPAIVHVEMMKAARAKNITVLLSGQGGDEIFCGYKKYFFFAVQQLLQDRRMVGAAELTWQFFRNGTVLRQFSAQEAARYTRIPLPGVKALPLGEQLAAFKETNIGLQARSVSDRQLADLLHFSAPAINHAEDRSSMAVSREVRFPFFDHRIMEFGLSLPLDHKVAEGWTKRVLRLAAEPFLPAEVVWRKDKTGHFTATVDWLVHKGQEVMRRRIDEGSAVFRLGYLEPRRFLPRWHAFWRGEPSGLSVQNAVSVLSLESWLKSFAASLRG